jgi:hypothetical protein
VLTFCVFRASVLNGPCQRPDPDVPCGHVGYVPGEQPREPASTTLNTNEKP